MWSAGERLRERLAGLAIAAPQIAYISAIDAAEHRDPQDIRALLVRQISSPVRWTNTVRAIVTRGALMVAECGPGGVLTGLNRRIERRHSEVACASLQEPADLDAALAKLRSA
jgi:[acyl-carrier-protein] S-malonyltransferase